MGLAPFRFILNDRRFRRLPMILETPKGTEANQDLDELNLQTLRALLGD
jgi:deoxyribonuclease-4